MSRHNTSTVKVSTKFGSLFIHVESNQDMTGASGIWVSKQQKLDDTDIDDLVHAIIEGVHEGIESLQGA
jgi:hypothetical protein